MTQKTIEEIRNYVIAVEAPSPPFISEGDAAGPAKSGESIYVLLPDGEVVPATLSKNECRIRVADEQQKKRIDEAVAELPAAAPQNPK